MKGKTDLNNLDNVLYIPSPCALHYNNFMNICKKLETVFNSNQLMFIIHFRRGKLGFFEKFGKLGERPKALKLAKAQKQQLCDMQGNDLSLSTAWLIKFNTAEQLTIAKLALGI